MRADLSGYRTLVSLVCAHCAGAFSVPPNEARRGAKFCGIACREAGKLKLVGSAHHSYKGRQPCKSCGKPVKSRQGGLRKFCSRTCFQISGMTNWIMADENGVKYAGRIDENQPEIVDALRKAGASVIVSSNLGNGFPDLIVGVPSNTILMEIKNPKGSYGKAGLNKLQQAFHAAWPGPIYVVNSIEEALAVLVQHGKIVV